MKWKFKLFIVVLMASIISSCGNKGYGCYYDIGYESDSKIEKSEIKYKVDRKELTTRP